MADRNVGDDLTVDRRVELRAGSLVEGDVYALRLAIEDNAVFRGKVDLTQGAKGQESAPASARS